MHIGVFVDLRRHESSRRSFTDHVARTIELLVAGEQQGLGAAWFTEHHGFPDGYLPQPLLLAAAVAARTSRIRLGTGILLAPLRHARHIAEEAALVDVISGGRAEVGLGAGYGPDEFAMFGADLRTRFAQTDATTAEVRRQLASGEITPPPVQDPLPLWLGYQGPKGARRAGRIGVGLLSLDPALREPYEQGLAEGGHDASMARYGGLLDVVVADDPEAAAERILPHWLHQQNTYRAIMRKPDGTRLSLLDEGRVRETLATTGRLGSLQVLDVPGAIAAVRERTAGRAVRHVYVWLSVGDMPEDLVERQLELWCGPVREGLRDATPGAAEAEEPSAR